MEGITQNHKYARQELQHITYMPLKYHIKARNVDEETYLYR
jgi:hypothetical protein